MKRYERGLFYRSHDMTKRATLALCSTVWIDWNVIYTCTATHLQKILQLTSWTASRIWFTPVSTCELVVSIRSLLSLSLLSVSVRPCGAVIVEMRILVMMLWAGELRPQNGRQASPVWNVDVNMSPTLLNSMATRAAWEIWKHATFNNVEYCQCICRMCCYININIINIVYWTL